MTDPVNPVVKSVLGAIAGTLPLEDAKKFLLFRFFIPFVFLPFDNLRFHANLNRRLTGHRYNAAGGPVTT